MDLHRIRHLAVTALLFGALPALYPLRGAMAQFSAGTGGDTERDAADAQQQAEAKAAAKAAAPPPAIPGAVTDEATATSGHAATDVEPTAALFDAVNRGDMTAAKEALGRGADLNGRNVLGQSPLDMAIDLNRNDITFLLLLMRNQDGPPAAAVASADPGAGDNRGRRAGRPAVRVRVSRVEDGPTARPQRFAADGGTPKPEVGFLGFNGN